MLKSSARSAIRLRGVRHNNLKNFDLDLPLNQLIVITGLSGSGKSSLAFDTLFAEGQRRYIETFSPYARQFFDRMDKPQVDSIEGIPPAIAIEQRNAVKTTRSTVGTMTEICDYMKMLWPHVAQLHCSRCGRPVRKDSPKQIWEMVRGTMVESEAHPAPGVQNPELIITFDLPLSEKISFEESLAMVARQGYQRLLFDGQILRLDEAASLVTRHSPVAPKSDEGGPPVTLLTVIQDRLKPLDSNRPRFIEACEQAYHFGKGKLAIHQLSISSAPETLSEAASGSAYRFSNRLHCAQCNLEYREPSPALFSFNNPLGACPACRGFGRVISIDYNLALPDRSKTLAQGVVKPWQTGHGIDSQRDLLRMCRHFEIPTNVPFEKLPRKWQDLVIHGEPDYGKDEEHEWPRAWYGIKGYFRWLESKAYKMHVRVLLSRYRTYTPCPDCHGKRFQPESLLYRCNMTRAEDSPAPPREKRKLRSALSSSSTLADFYELPIRDALAFIERLAQQHRSRPNDPLGLVLNEVRSRLGYLNEVGLGYLTLGRPTRSLSGGETERVNLTTCLGTRLVNTLFVLDEPSVGLHPRDTARLVRILQQLRDAGNTVVVVEHEASVMRAADQIIDLGPGHGATGGQVVFQGTYRRLLKSKRSLTGQYLSGRKRLDTPPRRSVTAGRGSDLYSPSTSGAYGSDSLVLNDASRPMSNGQAAFPVLRIAHATRHNLKDLTVNIPLGRFVCLTGVSGSGKTTLVRDVLLPALTARLQSEKRELTSSDPVPPESNEDEAQDSAPEAALLEGSGQLAGVVLVDQSILARTPRSNPAVYTGAFDDIREFFAQSDAAKQRGLNASSFSFNSGQGQCERCRGAGFEKIEMQFLSDIFIRCPDCNGRRYRAHILEVKVQPFPKPQRPGRFARGARLRNRLAPNTQHPARALSIADLLESTIDEAIEFLASFRDARPARRAVESLQLLQEVGLGYLKLGQPLNTLSGGESQRLKLVRHLAEVVGAQIAPRLSEEGSENVFPSSPARRLSYSGADSPPAPRIQSAPKMNLFLFDEPTTGLHFDDVRVLLKVFQRLVNSGHSVLVIEHNLDVIKSADWIIDLGPDAGDEGGQLVAEGTPEEIARCEGSRTGEALREVLDARIAQLYQRKSERLNQDSAA